MFCHQCGTEAKPSAKFCHACGHQIEGEITPPPPPPPTIEHTQEQPPAEALKPSHHPWRRLFARTFDLICVALPVYIAAIVLTQNSATPLLRSAIVLGVLGYLLWLPIEAAFLAAAGATPGKWIFGIRVLKPDGSKLTFGNAIERSIRAFAQGDAMGIPVLSPITRFIAYRTLTKTGTTPWDQASETVVTHSQWGTGRMIAGTLAVVSSLVVFGTINTVGKILDGVKTPVAAGHSDTGKSSSSHTPPLSLPRSSVGDHCNSHDDCSDGMYCWKARCERIDRNDSAESSGQHTPPLSIPRSGVGSFCNSNADCSKGMMCWKERCERAK